MVGSKLYLFILAVFWSLGFSVKADQFDQGMQAMQAGNFAEAFCLWRPLAMQGHQEAAYHLGWLYANGNGLRVDIVQAIYWWGQAANRGHKDAMFALALAYTTGEGIGQDDREAVHWYLKAADAGHEDAREIIRTKVSQRAPEVRERLARLIDRPWLGDPVTVTVEKANLRSGPGTHHDLLETVTRGAQFIAVGKTRGWYQIIDPDDLSYRWVAGWLTDPPLKRP